MRQYKMSYEVFWLDALIIAVVFLLIASIYTFQIVLGFDYQDCKNVDKNETELCDLIFPPPLFQAVNWTMVPFP